MVGESPTPQKLERPEFAPAFFCGLSIVNFSMIREHLFWTQTD